MNSISTYCRVAFGRDRVVADRGPADAEYVHVGRQGQAQLAQHPGLDVVFDADLTFEGDFPDRNQRVDLGIEFTLLALRRDGVDRQLRRGAVVLVGVRHGLLQLVAEESRQLIFADFGHVRVFNRRQREFGAGQQGHHAFLPRHVQCPKYRHRDGGSLPGGVIEQLLVGHVQNEFTFDRPVQEYTDMAFARSLRP